MSKDEAAIEAEIKEKGLTAKRITPEGAKQVLEQGETLDREDFPQT